MAFIGSVNDWNQFSADVISSNNQNLDDAQDDVKDYCYKCDKETLGWEDTWICPVDGKHYQFYCYECCEKEATKEEIKG